MSRAALPLCRVGLAGALLGLSAPALADEKLDKKLFLLGRALKNNDCQQALEMSDKLVDEFGDDESVYWARARSLACMGNHFRAWLDMEKYREMGGSDPAAVETDNEIGANIEVVSMRVEPQAVEVPADFMDGVRVTVSGQHAVVTDGPGQYRMALAPGPHQVRVAHSDLPVAPWSDQFVAEGGNKRSLVATPVMQIGDLVVQLQPADEAGNVQVAWRSGGSPADAEWTALTPAGAGQFTGRLAAGPVELQVQPRDPRIGWATGAVTVEPGARTDTELTVARLEAATLRVGDLDPALSYTVTLPTGEVREVVAGADIETGAGEARWAVEWENDGEGDFTVAPGSAALALPRGVELTSAAWEGPQRWLLENSTEAGDVTVQPSLGGELDFAVSVPSLRPGEVRQLSLDIPAVPALQSHAAMLDARGDWKKSRRQTWLAGGATALLAGFTGVTLSQALAAADEAKGLSDPGDADTYADLVDQTASRAQLANIGLWSGVAGTGLTATLTWRSLGRSKQHKARVDEFEAARKVPHVASAGQSASGGEG